MSEETQQTTWQERVQSEYIDLKAKLEALASHLLHNAEDLERDALNLLRRQETAMHSYLSILHERLVHHQIEIPGENSDGE